MQIVQRRGSSLKIPEFSLSFRDAQESLMRKYFRTGVHIERLLRELLGKNESHRQSALAGLRYLESGETKLFLLAYIHQYREDWTYFPDIALENYICQATAAELYAIEDQLLSQASWIALPRKQIIKALHQFGNYDSTAGSIESEGYYTPDEMIFNKLNEETGLGPENEWHEILETCLPSEKKKYPMTLALLRNWALSDDSDKKKFALSLSGLS